MSFISATLFEPIQQYMNRWFERKNPPSSDAILLHSRRLYILPTRFGYIFSAVLLLLFLSAINYQNSMGFVLTFMLTALALVSLWQTHKNLLGIMVSIQAPKPVFAGETSDLYFKISHQNKMPRYSIGLQYPHQVPVYITIKPDSESQAVIKLSSSKRGQFKPKGITIFTRYPIGLFHAWGWMKFDVPIVVYPTHNLAPPSQLNLFEKHSGKASTNTVEGDDFSGLREYREGESLRHISWKAHAQGKGLLTKTFQSHVRPSLWIDWFQFQQNSIDAKLSEMTSLVLQAESNHQKYGIKLPGTTIEQALGAAHKHACLYAITTFKQTDFGEDFEPDIRPE